MRNAIATILTDENARGDQAVEATFYPVVAQPWS